MRTQRPVHTGKHDRCHAAYLDLLAEGLQICIALDGRRIKRLSGGFLDHSLVINDTHGCHTVRHRIELAVLSLKYIQIRLIYLIGDPGIFIQIIGCHIFDIFLNIDGVHNGNGRSLSACVKSHPFLFLTAVISNIIYLDIRIFLHKFLAQLLKLRILIGQSSVKRNRYLAVGICGYGQSRYQRTGHCSCH